MAQTCRVIGVLDNGLESLSPAVLARLGQGEVVIGAQRLLELCAPALSPAARLRPLEGHTTTAAQWVQEAWAAGQTVVVLASGDPLFHGLGSLLLKRLPPDHVQVEPNLSTPQLALARLGLAGEEVGRLSVHKGDSGDWQPGVSGPEHALAPLARGLARRRTLALLTSPANDPARIARMLLAEGLGEACRMDVCAHLLRADEEIFPDLAPAAVAERSWPDPNVVVIRWPGTPPVHPLLGLPDATYLEADGSGLVTRREVRAAALGQLALTGNTRVWDIGAGSGSLALEAARLCPDGWVWAVEKNSAAFARILENRRRLGVVNLSVTHAKAPAGMEAWPDPNAVFIGGSCGNLAELIRLALHRLPTGGRLVLNFVTLENLAVAMTALNSLGAPWEATQIHAPRTRPIKGMSRLEGAAPVWIVTALKEAP